MNELALFAGAGGGILGGKLLGWRTVCAVEWEPYAASVLAARQNDGLLPAFPIWDDVCTFDGRFWRGVVDVVSGGFPCQDISLAGKGAGISGERSGLWREMARIVGEVRPRFVFVENSPALIARGLGRVLGDLAALGYDCRWTVLGAGDIGAPHQRDRFWLVAYADVSEWWQERGPCDRLAQPAHGLLSIRKEGASGFGAGREALADADREGQLQQGRLEREERRRTGNGGAALRDTDSEGLAKRQGEPGDDGAELAAALGAGWWLAEPDVGRVADGVAARVDRLKALGNGQVPQCAAAAWRLLMPHNAELTGRSGEAA